MKTSTELINDFTDRFATFAVSATVAILRVLPFTIVLTLFNILIRIIFFVMPKYRKVAGKNLALAFPELSQEQRNKIYKDSLFSLARCFADSVRAPFVTKKWAKEHIQFPNEEDLLKLKEDSAGNGIMLLTGHLGSFELLGQVFALYNHHISFVARDFKLVKLNNWYKSMRERNGNRSISRIGAYKHIVNHLHSNSIVAILFDQNVTRNYAVFADFFGRKAATTKTIGLVYLKVKPKVALIGFKYTGNGQYTVIFKEVDFTDIYIDSNLSSKEKVELITHRANQEYQKIVTSYPQGWFWIHKRWQATPEGVPEDFYETVENTPILTTNNEES